MAIDAEELAPFDATGQLLKTFLVGNDIALVRVGYFRQLHANRGRLQRRQQLPKTAIVVGEQIMDLTFGKYATRLFAVSHAWLSTEHPDPSGAQLEELLLQVENLRCADESLVFYDFCSLYQIDKMHPEVAQLKPGENLRPGHPAGITPPQLKATRAATAGIDLLYASAMCEVVVLPTVHNIANLVGPVCTRNRLDYINRGWCRIEFCVAKFFGRIANTSVAKVRALLGQDHALHPEEFERRLVLGDIAFTSTADKQPALAIYRRFYAAASKPQMLAEIKAGRAREHQKAIESGLGALDWRVRRDFIAALGAKRIGEAAPSVCARLADPDCRVRIAAKAAIARLGPIANLTSQTAEKLASPDAEVRVDALRGLAKLGHTSLSQAAAVAEQLSHSDVFVVKAAKEALVNMGLAGTDAAATLLADRDAQTRDAARQVVAALGSVGEEAVAETLAARIASHVNGASADTLRELICALAASGPSAARHAAVVVRHLGHLDASVRCVTLETIIAMGPLGAEATAALLTHHDAEVRGQAVRALETIGHVGGAASYADAVARLLSDESWPVRRRAVHFLACLGEPELEAHALEIQRLFDEDPDEDVRREAAALLDDRPCLVEAAARQRQERIEAEARMEAEAAAAKELLADDFGLAELLAGLSGGGTADGGFGIAMSGSDLDFEL
mmetsp:Transcript_36028/g.103586  ORF Transcript_36028/g.103586 Transcript_36028/m.103586 type:complete len:678 (-) Transcript_36028:162-2195(-)